MSSTSFSSDLMENSPPRSFTFVEPVQEIFAQLFLGKYELRFYVHLGKHYFSLWSSPMDAIFSHCVESRTLTLTEASEACNDLDIVFL